MRHTLFKRRERIQTVESVVSELRAKGSQKTRAIYARHGMAAERTLGVSVADMKAIAKKLRGKQELALRLYATRIMEAQYLAGMVADGKKLTRKQLDDWAEGSAGMQMVSEYTVPWVAVEGPVARECALKWIESKKEHEAAAGWSTRMPANCSRTSS